MLLVGISGASKCDWILIKDQKEFFTHSTHGLSPFFDDEEQISKIITDDPWFEENRANLNGVFFFGAGCSSKLRKQIVNRALEKVFPSIIIYVNHDVVGYAFATYDGTPGITCILGTGSNSVFFDGDIVREEIPALDYILGDEGSGSYYGKHLLKDFLYGNLPKDLHAEFVEDYNLTKDNILDTVYMRPRANEFFASFMKFYQKHQEHEYVKKSLENGMGEFMDTHVLCYRNYQDYQVHFVGSIAHYFSSFLKKAAKKRNIKVGKIIKEPVSGLVEYYLKYYKDNIPK